MGPVAVCPEMRVATDVHLHPAVTEPRELMDQTGEAVIAHGRGDTHLEARATTSAERVLGDRLCGVRCKPSGPLQLAPVTMRKDDPRPDERLSRAIGAELGLAAQPREAAHGVGELSVRAHLVERRLRHGDAELRLEGERELDEIQRIDGELVRERYVARQLFGPDAEMICYQAPDARLHEIKHTQPPPKRAVVSRGYGKSRIVRGLSSCITHSPQWNPPKAWDREFIGVRERSRRRTAPNGVEEFTHCVPRFAVRSRAPDDEG